MLTYICDLITSHPLQFSTQHYEMSLHLYVYASKKVHLNTYFHLGIFLYKSAQLA